MIKLFPIKVKAKTYCDLRDKVASEDADLFGSACLILAFFFIFSWAAGIVLGYLDKDNYLHLTILLNGFLLFIISLAQHLISDNYNLLFTITYDDFYHKKDGNKTN